MFCLHVCLGEDIRSLRTGVTDRCELPCECWALNRDPLEEQPGLLRTEFSLAWINPIFLLQSQQSIYLTTIPSESRYRSVFRITVVLSMSNRKLLPCLSLLHSQPIHHTFCRAVFPILSIWTYYHPIKANSKNLPALLMPTKWSDPPISQARAQNPI